MQSLSTSKASAKHRRGGRPPAGRAGEVDRRILDTATRLFLRDGYDAISLDRIAASANAGKASLYARYPTKQELFTAVVRRMVDRTLVPSADVPSHLPAEERLRETGHRLLGHALVPAAVALMRVCMSIAPRMPDLARLVDRIGREGGIAQVARAIAGGGATPEQVAQARPTAEQFIDMVFVPHQMRALIGDDREVLRKTAPRRVDDAIVLLPHAGKLIASEGEVGPPSLTVCPVRPQFNQGENYDSTYYLHWTVRLGPRCVLAVRNRCRGRPGPGTVGSVLSRRGRHDARRDRRRGSGQCKRQSGHFPRSSNFGQHR